jgi:carbonic anhydrase
MTVRDEILGANDLYAAHFDKGDLTAPPSRRFAVVTCMDARLDPARFLGLSEGDAHVIRNAGGLVTDDALRSLVISHHELGTQEAFVIGHEGCGMIGLSNEHMREQLGPAAANADFLGFADLDEAVRGSVRAIEESPLLPASFGATGFVYDVRTGRLRQVD